MLKTNRALVTSVLLIYTHPLPIFEVVWKKTFRHEEPRTQLVLQRKYHHFQSVDRQQDKDQSSIRLQFKPVLRTGALIDRHEQTTANEAKNIIRIEVRFLSKADVVNQLWKQDQVPEYDHPSLISEEVVHGKVDEKSKVELYVESS